MVLENYMLQDLKKLAETFELRQLILFGSRATGQCSERSDIDLAAYFHSAKDYLEFCDRVEDIRTLLMFDVVNLSSDMISLDLRQSIEDEGVVIYEKV